jgi:hypothetical protein
MVRSAARAGAEVAGLLVALGLAAALAVLTVSQAACVLLAAPAGAGAWSLARRWTSPRTRWRALTDADRRRRELIDAIDRAPHRHARGRRPPYDLYGAFVEHDGPNVAVSLVRRPPGPRRRRAQRTSVAEQRLFAGDEVEAAVAWRAEVEELAAAAERKHREQIAGRRAAAQQARLRERRAAEDARMQAIEDAHERDLAAREVQLAAEDRRARERERELEAEALARALRRR